jgi:hypothetical protein
MDDASIEREQTVEVGRGLRQDEQNLSIASPPPAGF